MLAVDEKIFSPDENDLESTLAGQGSDSMSDMRSSNIVTPSGMNRMIVLIPDQDVDEVRIGRKILSQAFLKRLDVVLVSLVQDPENKYMARRRLATMMTLLRGPLLSVETKVFVGRSWVRAVAQIKRYGDLIYCPAELTDLSSAGVRKPLDEVLKKALSIQVVTYSGFYHNTHTRWPIFFNQLGYWMVVCTIIFLFYLFETNSNFLAMGWTGQVFACIIVTIEIAVIYYWTSIAG